MIITAVEFERKMNNESLLEVPEGEILRKELVTSRDMAGYKKRQPTAIRCYQPYEDRMKVS